MIDITEKDKSVRVAVARGSITMSKEAMEKIKTNKIPKGNVLEIARAAGMMGAKKTSDLIPDCHPIDLTNTKIEYNIIEPDKIEITATVKAVDRTGAEMEALTAVSVCALCIYDMCKPIDKWMIIQNIMLMEKSGGKSGTLKRKQKAFSEK